MKKDRKRQVKSLFPHPVLNTYRFSSIYSGDITLCKRGHLREVEFFAYKGSLFEVLEVFRDVKRYIYRVRTDIYNGEDLYLDSLFVEESVKKKYSKVFPEKERIISDLKRALGMPYLWGGNIFSGLESWNTLYPIFRPLPKDVLDIKKGIGFDCSGLINWASANKMKDGTIYPTIPRNSSDMIRDSFGEVIKIEGMDVYEIDRKLKPLDLILYKGHVIIVLDERYMIESMERRGVLKTGRIDRLKKLVEKKKPIDRAVCGRKNFLVKRWYFDK